MHDVDEQEDDKTDGSSSSCCDSSHMQLPYGGVILTPRAFKILKARQQDQRMEQEDEEKNAVSMPWTDEPQTCLESKSSRKFQSATRTRKLSRRQASLFATQSPYGGVILTPRALKIIKSRQFQEPMRQ